MASKFFYLFVIVLHLIHEGVCLCPYPEIPNHGIGHIINSEDTRKVRPLEENEKFEFDCEFGWMLPYDSDNLFTCRGGILRSIKYSSSIHPTCEKKLNLSTWEIVHEAVKIHEEEWCESGEVLQIELTPKIHNVQIEEIKEVTVRMCESSEKVLQLRINDFFNCTVLSRNRHRHVFRCDHGAFTGEMVNKIAITANGPVMIEEIIVLTRLDDYCGSPSIPIGGNITKISLHKFQYSCNPGLQLSGNAIAKCDPSTGRWTGAPTCVAVDSSTWLWISIFVLILIIWLLSAIVVTFLFKHTRERNIPGEVRARDTLSVGRTSHKPTDTSRPEELVHSSVDVESVVEASDGYLEPRVLNQEPHYEEIDYSTVLAARQPAYENVNFDANCSALFTHEILWKMASDRMGNVPTTEL